MTAQGKLACSVCQCKAAEAVKRVKEHPADISNTDCAGTHSCVYRFSPTSGRLAATDSVVSVEI